MSEIKKVPWSAYRSVLLPLIEKTERRNKDNFSKQIDEALSHDRAFLFVANDGFMVLEPSSKNGVGYMNIMFALNKEPEAISRYYAMVEELARGIGAKWMTTQTKVRALKPHIESHGFRLCDERDGVMFFKRDIKE